MTPHGEIVKFISGSHSSSIGAFEIDKWSRTPLFPSHNVCVGETWTYKEELAVKLKSFWIKEIDPEPYHIHATSVLVGFAKVGMVRCAVIETEATEKKREQLKVLFKKIDFMIESKIKMKTYFDYKTGTVIATITSTESRTEGKNVNFTDTGKSQSVSWLVSPGL